NSKEKNISLEESRRRMDASLARKRNNAAAIHGRAENPDSPQSPSSSGAMDTLLEKLRAAAPQARDQRDRRRRARLKERHQVRVASGQNIPDLAADTGEKSTEGDADDANSANNGDLLSPGSQPDDPSSPVKESQVSEGEDIADRAASMLQGLRNDTEGSADRARRRESAEEARRNRRLRRRTPASNGGSKDGGDINGALSPVKEPDTAGAEEGIDGQITSPISSTMPDDSPRSSETPSIVVSGIKEAEEPSS
ncbi:hypothetical protein ACJ72_07835, partial [Emergomyces africanus]